MAETIRFPLLEATNGVGPTEAVQVITLLSGVATLLRGGGNAYTPLTPWKLIANTSEAPFTCVVVEFESNANAFTIGNGVTPIGLYGEINEPGGNSFKTLLGILGINITGTNVPVIPLDVNAGAETVGYSQVIANVAAYDALSVGGVGGDIALAEGDLVTVRVRPFRRRSFLG